MAKTYYWSPTANANLADCTLVGSAWSTQIVSGSVPAPTIAPVFCTVYGTAIIDFGLTLSVETLNFDAAWSQSFAGTGQIPVDGIVVSAQLSANGSSWGSSIYAFDSSAQGRYTESDTVTGSGRYLRFNFSAEGASVFTSSPLTVTLTVYDVGIGGYLDISVAMSLVLTDAGTIPEWTANLPISIEESAGVDRPCIKLRDTDHGPAPTPETPDLGPCPTRQAPPPPTVYRRRVR